MNMGWHSLEGMSAPRANFALTVLDNMVYVYGGISGTGQGKESHFPTLCQTIAERYNPNMNKWENIEINNAPCLAAFGWTSISPNGDKMLIVGGTDGYVIQQETWTIDFKNLTATMGSQFDYQITMNKLIHRAKDNTVYCFGGYNSMGENYKIDLKQKEPEWESYERKHSALLSLASSSQAVFSSVTDISLVHYNSMYFE